MEILSAFLFYLTSSLFGFIGVPVTSRIIQSRKLALSASKLIGLVIFGYLIWIFSFFKLLDYQSRGLILAFFFVFIFCGVFIIWKFPVSSFKSETPLQPKKKKLPAKPSLFKEILWIEIISILLYFFYLWVRSHNAGASNTEHFMDMVLLSSAGKTNYFPFIDPWFAGKLINYYYYGSYLISLISNLAQVSYSLSYNLALGFIFTQSALLSGALAYAITGLKKCATLAGFLVTSAGTLFFAACTLKGAFANPATVCSYASSTRLYTPSYIINEIPSYSFTVGNLHAHLLALPFFILFLILLYAGSLEAKPRLWSFILLGFLAATSGMINAWDLITESALFASLVIFKIFQTAVSAEERSVKLNQIKKWILSGFLFAGAAAIFITPSLINFSSPVLGLGFIPSYVSRYNLQNVQYPTPIMALLGMWGIFLAGIFLARKVKENYAESFLFLLALCFVSIGILAGVELFFIEDIYSISNPPYFRANTTFKFGFHAWVMLSILLSVLAASFYKLQRRSFFAIAGKFLFAFAVLSGVFFTYQGSRQYFFVNADSRTLDNFSWFKKISESDWAAVQFINRKIPGREVIAEAVGDSYTNFSRISTFTGMITPMGWRTHEWTWRFDGRLAKKAPIGQTVETGWGVVALTSGDIDSLYRTSDIALAKKIIDKYGIKYIYVGDLERSTYSNLDEQKFFELGRVIFESKGAKLFSL